MMYCWVGCWVGICVGDAYVIVCERLDGWIMYKCKCMMMHEKWEHG